MTTPPELPRALVSFLQDDDRSARCPADQEYAASIMDAVLTNECEDMLHAAAQGRWRKANTYSYDGVRKCIEAWLLANGWRIRPVAGAHAAVVEIVDRWLESAPNPGPRIARSFGASRKARHDDEYPSPTAPHRTDSELRALVLDNVRLINRLRAALGVPETNDVLPTDETLAARPER